MKNIDVAITKCWTPFEGEFSLIKSVRIKKKKSEKDVRPFKWIFFPFIFSLSRTSDDIDNSSFLIINWYSNESTKEVKKWREESKVGNRPNYSSLISSIPPRWFLLSILFFFYFFFFFFVLRSLAFNFSHPFQFYSLILAK